MGDYVVIREYRNGAEQAFTLRARTVLYSLLTLAASQLYGSAQYVPKVFHAY